MRKRKKGIRGKFMLLLIVFVVLFVSLFCSLKSSYMQVHEKISEKENLAIKYNELLDEQDMLEKEVVKMQNPEYIGRYVREKYMYSKDGELILRIDE